MKRKDFIKTVSLSAAATAIPFQLNAKINDVLPIIKPPKIKKGDKIGIIAPGSFITEAELEDSKKNLTELGFIPIPSKNILAKKGYLGGEDKLRADDVNEMFADKSIKGIMCARGGYGCARILPMLDYNVIKSNPKVLVGYSDITALLYGIFSKTGLVCFHGPVGISTFNPFSVTYFNDVLVDTHENLTLISQKEEKEEDGSLKIIRSGKGQGQLVGGNLSIVVSLIGTEFDIDTTGKIVFIEEVGEEPYRIDRMLTQMIQAGKFKNAAGIALGVFSKCEPKKNGPEFPQSFTLFEVLEDRLYDLNIPVLYGMSFGHITNKFTLPFGILAELDSMAQSLTLLETSVI
ncbi:MAG TPA: LD-carboxypeptidase [Ignavibacteriaceae bacterium]|nr:LD-carboxypeptidase [Ignavibacteriaceae bacterium]